jgi:hypothetical protein
MTKLAVNKNRPRFDFVNRLSAQQRAILLTVAAYRWEHPFTGERRTGYVARSSTLRALMAGDARPRTTNSQRASLSRSLRRLHVAGYITRDNGSIALTKDGKRAAGRALKG